MIQETLYPEKRPQYKHYQDYNIRLNTDNNDK